MFFRTLLLAASLVTGLPQAAKAVTVVVTGTHANANPLLPPGSGRCAPAYFNTAMIGPGNGTSTGTSNLGAFTSTQSHCIASAPPTPIIDGLFTYDFGAGDTLTGAYTGDVFATATPGGFNSTENLIVTGGTGQFLGANGTITTNGSLSLANGIGNDRGIMNGRLNLSSAVPEPPTWAMLVGGFGVIGATARRRRPRLVMA